MSFKIAEAPYLVMIQWGAGYAHVHARAWSRAEAEVFVTTFRDPRTLNPKTGKRKGAVPTLSIWERLAP